jgi:thymidylate kinase
MSFIVVEGPNGAGKTTLINNFKSNGYNVLSSPNGTPLAKMLRPACRGTDPWEDIDKQVQFLLFSAARLDEYIRCVEGEDETTVADRWWTSTYVYQCKLQGIPISFLEQTMHPEEQIDLVIILGGDSDQLIDRVIAEREKDPDHGVCTWTKERDSMVKSHDLYANDLPDYLESKDIPFEEIDTTDISTTEVFELAESLVHKYTGCTA